MAESARDRASSIAIDSEQDAYVSGDLSSTHLLLVKPHETYYGALSDALVVKLRRRQLIRKWKRNSAIESTESKLHMHVVSKGVRRSMDALDWIALVTSHIPNPHEKMVRYYGCTAVQNNREIAVLDSLRVRGKINIITLKVDDPAGFRYATGAMKREREYDYTVLFEPAEEGGFVVTCPALPGLITEGDTLDEARARAKDAIRAYLESLRKDGLSIPSDVQKPVEPIKEQIRVALEVA